MQRMICRLFIAGLGLLPGVVLAQAGDDALAACHAAAVEALPEITRPGLVQIDGMDRQLLAMTSYLRTRNLAPRWSWNEAEIAKYEGSPERQTALSEISKVQAQFAESNPGFRLHVNLQVRSLDQQIAKWNSNASVGTAAGQLMAEAPMHCDDGKSDGLVTWLRGFRPSPRANLAAPGLSAHGQGRAFDFQVYEGNQLIAGADSRQIGERWLEGGWAEKLKQAITESSDRFTGPLTSPNEPWHYNYHPAAPE